MPGQEALDGSPPPPAAPQSLDEFLAHFLSNHRDENFLSVKQGNYTITEAEFVGEVADWIQQYLQYMSCPSHLEADITREVLNEAKNRYIHNGFQGGSDEVDGGNNGISRSEERSVSCDQLNNTEASSEGRGLGSKAAFKSMLLLKDVTSTMNEVCKRLKSEGSTVKTGRVLPSAVSAIKNGRRRMEDRHVALHDVNLVFGDILPKLKNEPPLSFYGVYDGHAGKDAAAYAACSIHERMLASDRYPADPILAIKEAFVKTDETFRNKNNDEHPLSSGTTAVCSLIRGNTLYSAWLGDSQAVLVRNGEPLHISEPHKPNRPDEKARIEELGGTVIYWGTWRVNGQLAVSRAIGDAEYKPYVSSEPDVTTVEMNGSEDFIIIACDGLWDTVTPIQATQCVFQQLREDK
ncbi:hypothetical protein TCAL_02396, partial [Tigriopus californicus]